MSYFNEHGYIPYIFPQTKAVLYCFKALLYFRNTGVEALHATFLGKYDKSQIKDQSNLNTAEQHALSS